MRRIIVYDRLRPLLLQEKGLLGRTDLIICAVPDTDRALALHRDQPASLCILDLGMPGMPVEAFCQAVRSDPATRGVSLVLVGSGDARDRMRSAAVPGEPDLRASAQRCRLQPRGDRSARRGRPQDLQGAGFDRCRGEHPADRAASSAGRRTSVPPACSSPRRRRSGWEKRSTWPSSCPASGTGGPAGTGGQDPVRGRPDPLRGPLRPRR